MKHAAFCEEGEWENTYPSSSKDTEWSPSKWISRCAWRHPISTAKDFSVPFSEVLEKTAAHYEYISIDPDVLGGTPRIDGTRIPVYMILDSIEHYGNLDGALISYPSLTKDQVSQAVSFAAEVLEHPIDHQS